MRPLLVTAACLTLALGTACTSPDAEPVAPSAAPAPTASAGSSPAAAPSPATDPLEFGSEGRDCSSRGDRILLYDRMTVKRPLTLEDVTLTDASGVRIVGPTVARRPDGALETTGSILGRAPGARDRRTTGWAGREPLAGAELTPGDWYFFVPLSIERPGRYGSMAFSWSDGSRTGSSTFRVSAEFRPHCV